jgi:ABC-type dipeptide/oligopeptide/nickel transport system ATPase subunit
MKDLSTLLELSDLTNAVNQKGVWVDLVKGISSELVQGQVLAKIIQYIFQDPQNL